MLTEKLIIDTDIGDDIDDAFCLALACAEPKAELLAVTTVFKNVSARAKQAAQLLDTAGKGDIPVYVGCGLPLSGKIPEFHVPEKDLLNVLPCQYDESMNGYEVRGDAACAIAELAKKHSGELTVVTIGAATNLALALERYPEIVRDIKQVVMMGGWFSVYQPEWNVLCDPEAMDAVFRSGLTVKAVGLDVTLQCGLEKSLLDAFSASEKSVNKLLTNWLKKWFAYFNFEKSVMHDPLALATVFDPQLCKFEEVWAKVTTEGNMRGAIETSKTEKQGFSKILAATTVNKNRFYDTVKNLLL